MPDPKDSPSQPASAAASPPSADAASKAGAPQAPNAEPPKTGAKAKPMIASKPRAKPEAAGGPIALLKADHRKVEALFDQYEQAEDGRKADLVRQICAELTLHTLVEEQLFYPACRKAAGQDEAAEDGLDEAQVEHDGAKLLIADLWGGGEGDDFRDAKVKVLGEQIRHHVAEEEKPGEGVFAHAQDGGVDTPQLADQLKRLKQQLQSDLDAGRLGPTPPVSIRFQPRPGQGRYLQEDDMPERDERGRFTSDDDDRRGGRRYDAEGDRGRNQYSDDRGRSGGRGQEGRGQEGRGQGGWFGDPEGHSQASREGWDERRGEGRSYGRGRDDDDDRGYRSRGGGRDRGQGGWFGDSEGHSRAAREGWDNPDHGRSGWYGDSRGHAEASRRGWDNPDHGPSGWYGDSEGHSRASREGWDNPNHGRSGWYGDPEGHSEASRRGWDDRRDEGRSYGRGRDDDDRGYRSRGRDDDDDDDDRRGGGRGRGQGGWFGDSEGHSEASRRGWQDRR